MAAEMDYPTTFSMLEGGCGKGTENEDLEASDTLKRRRLPKPPRHLSLIEHCVSSAHVLPEVPLEIDLATVSLRTRADENISFRPVFRSGCCSEIGTRSCMEDEYVCIDDLTEHVGEAASINMPAPGAFYGVFDGHGGTDAAVFVRENILKLILGDTDFPGCVKKSITRAFLKADNMFAETESLDNTSGTTALTALLFGRIMLIANVGDCRAVMGKRGKAVELSKDHKPNCKSERLRIEKLGGVVYDGYLNGQLSVSRALGDWHMKRTSQKGGPPASSSSPSSCPLSGEPELHETLLTEEDEFLILGCDGLWDVMSSQYAVTVARKELMLHNDPERCSRVLVREALKLNASDNLTVVVVCFSVDPPPRIEVWKSKFRKSISAEGLNLLQGVLESNA
ncbi:hypothetical protein V2J09_016709 [Rumex salicifolius]